MENVSSGINDKQGTNKITTEVSEGGISAFYRNLEVKKTPKCPKRLKE